MNNENAIVENNRADMAKLYAKMAAVMGGVQNIPKDGYNKFHKYHYATSDAITSVIRKLMAKNNLAFFADIVNIVDENGKYVVEYLYTFACGDTGCTHSCTWYGEAQNTNSKGGIDDKALAKSATIAQKYFLMKTFNVSTGDDEDTDSNENGRDTRKQSNREPKKQPPKITEEEIMEFFAAFRNGIDGAKELTDRAIFALICEEDAIGILNGEWWNRTFNGNINAAKTEIMIAWEIYKTQQPQSDLDGLDPEFDAANPAQPALLDGQEGEPNDHYGVEF